MNIGAASLYFTQYENIKKFYGFEPFPDTYKQALHNIAIQDEKIRNRFELFNSAISDRDAAEDICVYSEHSRSRSIINSSGDIQSQGRSAIRKVRIEKIEARRILKDIFTKEKGKLIILKIDIEGSEYAVFDNLAGTGILEQVDRLIMEYHRGIMPLLTVIDKLGFGYRIKGTDRMGFIFAEKRGSHGKE